MKPNIVEITEVIPTNHSGPGIPAWETMAKFTSTENGLLERSCRNSDSLVWSVQLHAGGMDSLRPIE